jgi:transposase InsO family protein
MRVLHHQTREAYGARKMWQLLNREGRICGRHRVARLRRLAGIVALRRRRFVRTVQVRQHETPAIPNRLNQQFTVSAKNRVWAGDLTFVPTRTGWLTVAVLLDLYSRRVVGWAMSPRQTLSVVVEAWWMAWQRRRPAPGLIHHSDQGTSIGRGSIKPYWPGAGW